MGVVNVTIDTGLYLLLSSLSIPLYVANLISTSAGLVFSFFANRSFTFKSSGSWRKQALSFLLVVGFGLWAIQPAILAGLTPLLEANLSERLLADVIAKLAAISVALVWNFIGLRLVVFRAGGARPVAATVEDE